MPIVRGATVMRRFAEIPLSVWRQRAQSFMFRGFGIRYWAAGQGEPLLLLHGFPTAAWDWHYLWQPLTRHYRVIVCDMLGFGDSDKPRRHDYSLLEQADLQQALLDHLQVNAPVHLLAHDYGDSVAQELLARNEEGRFAVASCMFLNGALFAETQRALPLQKLLQGPLGWMFGRLFDRHGLDREFGRIFAPDTRPSESELDDYWSLIASNRGTHVLHRLNACLAERRRFRDRWVCTLQRTCVPLRLLVGLLDPASGSSTLVRYRALIADADVALLPGVGHYPHIEAPAQVLRHYLAFRQNSAPFMLDRAV